MEIIDIGIVNGQPVQVDKSGIGFGTVMPVEHDNALVDVGILAQIDLARLVAGEHGMDVEPLA